MKYSVHVGDRSCLVEVWSQGGELRCTVDGRAVTVHAAEPAAGDPWVAARVGDGVTQRFLVDVVSPTSVSLGSPRGHWMVSVRRGNRLAGAGATSGSQEVRCPMPGRVVKYLVAVGDEVAFGDTVVVVEAMKMENELKATAAGVVGELTRPVGDSVEAQAVLARIVPKPSD